MTSKNIYFPGLNGLRFIAAFLVVLDHLELFKSYFGFKTMWSDTFSAHLGSLGVTVFFVLSGFLITYLLLREKAISKIDIKNFYARRILRIWPLYYLIIVISFFIVPHLHFLEIPLYGTKEIDYGKTLFLYSVFLTNFAFVFLPGVAFANILWSVAVEEQFYLAWPVIIKFSKNILMALLIVLLIYLCLKLLTGTNLLNLRSYFPPKFYSLLDRTRISCMVIGGIGAYSIIENKPVIKYLFSKYTQIISLLCFAIILFNLIKAPFYSLLKNELFSFVIIIIIVNISSNKSTILNIENRIFNFLGKISYGIYVYHLFSVVLCIKLFYFYHLTSLMPYYLWSILLILSVSLLTILISHISYKYFEIFFLRNKTRYSTILSGDLTKEKQGGNSVL